MFFHRLPLPTLIVHSFSSVASSSFLLISFCICSCVSNWSTWLFLKVDLSRISRVYFEEFFGTCRNFVWNEDVIRNTHLKDSVTALYLSGEPFNCQVSESSWIWYQWVILASYLLELVCCLLKRYTNNLNPSSYSKCPEWYLTKSINSKPMNFSVDWAGKLK